MERKKLIWIIVSLCVGVIAIVIVGILFIDPWGKNPYAPAFSRSSPTPREGARDYVAAPSPGPSAFPRASDGDLIVFGLEESSPSPSGSPSRGDGIVVDVNPRSSHEPAASPVPAASAKPGPTAKSAASTDSSSSSRSAVKPSSKPTVKPQAVVARSLEYWVQTGSFDSRGRADDQKALLAEKGLSSVIFTKEVGGKTKYRVRIGPFGTKAEANGWADRVRKEIPGCKDAFVAESVPKRN
jgi:cell division septation protein DedD